MTTSVRTITCPACSESTELRRATAWTRSQRYLKNTNRPAALRYNSRGRTDIYFNDGHNCKGDSGE